MAFINTATDYLGRQYDSEKEVNRFLRKYEATAGMSHRMYAKRQPIRYTDWKGDIPFYQEVEKEPYVEMYIPQHRFTELVEQEKYLSYLEQTAESSKNLVDGLRRDERIRNENPSVQKAYEKYLMLLELARR